MKVTKGILFSLFLICYVALIAKSFYNHQEFFGMELNGYCHMNDDFSRVCKNKDQFLVRRGITDAVASKREDSLLFTLPTNFLKDYISIQTIHRGVAIFLLAVASISFILLLCKLKINFFLIIISIFYWLFSPQFLSYFYEFKLTMASITLTMLLFFVLFCFESSLRKFKSSSFIYAFILPFLLINVGYEVFCISRPLNIFIFLFVFLYLLFYHRKHFLLYLVSSVLCLFLIKTTNPDIRPDLSLFSARGESIVDSGDRKTIAPSARKDIKERILELKNLLNDQKDFEYSSEHVGNTGMRDLAMVSGLSFIIFIFSLISKRKRQDITNYIRDRNFYIPLLILSIFVAFLTPLAASSPVRGHRFSNFYFLFALLTIITINFIIRNINKKIFYIINILLLCSCFYYGKYKILIFNNYSFSTLFTEKIEKFRDGIEKIKDETKDIDKIDNITICDMSNPATFFYHPFWNGILYVTELGCKVKNLPQIFEEQGKECPCPEKPNSLCIIKTTTKDVEIKYNN